MNNRKALSFFLILTMFCFGATYVQAGAFTAEEEASTASIKDLDSPPKPKKQEKPSVPPALRKIKASIQVGFIIDEDGNVVAPRIVKSTEDRLNDVATDCIQKWKFVPGKKGGETVRVRVVLPMRFK